MIFIANKQNQVTARRIENEKPEGWETKNLLYVALVCNVDDDNNNNDDDDDDDNVSLAHARGVTSATCMGMCAHAPWIRLISRGSPCPRPQITCKIDARSRIIIVGGG